MTRSHNEVTVIDKAVCISAESALENVFFLNFDSFRAFCHLMSNLSAIVTDIVGRFMLEKVFVQNFRLLEIFFHKNFRMMIWALSTFLTVPIHVVPAKLSDDVFIFAGLTQNTETHVVIWATFVDVSELTVIAF